MGDYVIFSPNIAGELIDAGFKLKDQRRDRKNPAHWVYFFENTDELRRCVYELTHEDHMYV